MRQRNCRMAFAAVRLRREHQELEPKRAAKVAPVGPLAGRLRGFNRGLLAYTPRIIGSPICSDPNDLT
jgi:hypothetical protein